MERSLTAELRPRERRLVRAGFASLAALVTVVVAHTTTGVGGAGLEQPIRDWASSAVYAIVALIVAARALRVGERRGPWIVLALGMTSYCAGNLLWALWLQHLEAPPIPSASDALWLSLYPCSYVGLVWLARIRGRRLSGGAWLDGLIAGLGICAVGAAFVFTPVLDAAAGDAAAVATNLAYPVVDLLLAALVVGILAARGWRVDRLWGLIGAGFLVLCVGDCIYLVQVASGATDQTLWANVFYLGGVSLLALAAWQRPGVEHVDAAGARLFLPGAFVIAALVLLGLDHVSGLGHVPFALAGATLVAALCRTALAFSDLRALAETRRAALTDELTSLPNRRALLRSLDAALERSAADGGTLALLIIDLDHFKELNDTLGHGAGDAVLTGVGPRVRPLLGERDVLARLGGDEFGIVLLGTDEDRALLVAGQVRRAIEQPFAVRGMSLRGAASIGIALAPAHGTTTEELLARADVAMYRAKRLRSGEQVYAAEDDTHSRASLELLGELPDALAAGHVEAFFQPQADARTGRIVGVEALARWRHPVHGLVAPPAFVPLAEHSGLGRELTRAVLVQALDRCAAWNAAGHDLHVSVNTTVSDLLDTSFPGEVAAALSAAGVPAHRLVLEVTESSILADRARIDTVIAALRGLGCKLSLDDFGTGYSSLAHLKDLPVDELKIDRSFVMAMADDRVTAAIVDATLGLARSLGVTATAEGVEDQATWDRLVAAGCDVVQGYYLSPPLPAAALDELLARPPARYPVAASAR